MCCVIELCNKLEMVGSVVILVAMTVVVGCKIELCNELVMVGSVVILVSMLVTVLGVKNVSLIFSVSLPELIIL